MAEARQDGHGGVVIEYVGIVDVGDVFRSDREPGTVISVSIPKVWRTETSMSGVKRVGSGRSVRCHHCRSLYSCWSRGGSPQACQPARCDFSEA